jgi:hypothetical protein
MLTGSERRPDAEGLVKRRRLPPGHGIVFGMMLALPFWCCFGAMLWVFH